MIIIFINHYFIHLPNLVISAFDSKLEQPLFFNDYGGDYDADDDLDEDNIADMYKENCRIIEYKLKHGKYLLINETDIENLKSKITLSLYENVASLGRSLSVSLLNQNRLKNLLMVLYKINPSFFSENSHPEKSDLGEESFFEKKLDVGSAMKRYLRYCNNYRINPNFDDDVKNKFEELNINLDSD